MNLIRHSGRALAALLLALCLLCGCFAVAEETSDVVATVNGAPIYRSDVEDYYNYFVASYGSYFDVSDPEVQGMFWQSALGSLVEYEVRLQQVEAMNIQITDEDTAAAEAEWESYVSDVMAAYFGYTAEASEEETLTARTAALELMAANGITQEYFIEQTLISIRMEKLEASALEGVAVTDAEVEAYYTDLVAENKTQAEADPAAYVYAREEYNYFATYYPDYLSYFGLEPTYYQPEGYRAVTHILLIPDEAVMNDYTTKSALYEEQLEAAEAATATDVVMTVTAEDVDAAEAAVIASVQPTIDEINAKLANGADFNDLVAEYGQDPGMQDPARRAVGYAVHLDSITWDPAFVRGAYSVSNVGDVAEPVVGSNGVHIVYYMADIPAGADPLSSELREAFREQLLSAKQNEVVEAQLAAWMQAADVSYAGDGIAMAAGTYAESAEAAPAEAE